MALGSTAGCNLIIPDISHQPVIHNPFPQLSKIAVVPFFNQSDEPTVDGREFALAYFAELQAVPGFEVVPLGVVEEAIIGHQIDLSRPAEARRLAEVLEVDAVVIGAITDYTPYYPPRCGLRVEWYARNPGFHEIPAGYGLPWGTPDEEFIPAPLVFEAEMALAKAQLATQSPACPQPLSHTPGELMPLPEAKMPQLQSPQPPMTAPESTDAMPGSETGDSDQGEAAPAPGESDAGAASEGEAGEGEDASRRPAVAGDRQAVAYEEVTDEYDEYDEKNVAVVDGATGELSEELPAPDMPGNSVATGTTDAIVAGGVLPPDWPDERGFIPPPPSPVRPTCLPNDGPIITHTRIYHGNDSEFTEALASYYSFRDDARFGGWQTYLQRSNDFIRFCCHMHISEMLSARGGAGETRVVWRWPESR